MMNSNPCMEVDMREAVKSALQRRGRVEDRVAAGGVGLMDQSIYGQPAIAAGASGAAKKKRAPRKKKVVVEVKPIEAEVAKPAEEVVAVVAAGKKKSRKGTAGAKAGAAKNPWISHLKAFSKAHPDMKYKDAMKAAKATYKSK